MTIEEFETKFATHRKECFEIFEKIRTSDNGNAYLMDFFILAALRCSLQLSRSISILVKNDAGIGAISLARLHLDTLLRLWSAWLAPNPSQHVTSVLEGKRIDQLKDRTGVLMKDHYLIQTYSERFKKPWIVEVYKKTSGFVHFSGESIFQGFADFSESNGRRISKTVLSDSHILNQNDQTELFQFFAEVNRGIVQLALGWCHTKNNPDEAPCK